MSAANQQQETQLIPVGAHECVTCERCATTFAAVHPACPSCSAGERAWQVTKARLAAAETALQDEVAMSEQSVVTLRDLHKNWRRVIEEQDPDGGPLIESILCGLIEDVTPSSEARFLASPDAATEEARTDG